MLRLLDKMKNNNQRSISVVIPNYNGKHLLEANIPSVLEALAGIDVWELIIIDDASTDDSVNFIKQNYPAAKLLVNEQNKGFSPTINRGIFAAQYDLVLALNSDVQLTPNYFKEQFNYFEKPDTFGVMGCIKDEAQIHIQDAAKFPVVSFKGIKGSYNYLPTQLPNGKWLPSFFLSGANALMDRAKLLELKGFDEVYAPYYYEDADLGIRAWKVGWKCYFEPKAICTHAISSTISKQKSEKVKLIIERNRIIFNRLHLFGARLFFFNVWLWLRIIGKLLIGNTINYKAIKAYQARYAHVNQSQQQLQQLQQKHNCTKNIVDVKKEILQSIEGLSVRVF